MKALPFALLACLGFALALPAWADVLELRPQQVVNGNKVTLGDFLSSSQGVSEEELNTPLAEAPQLGRAKEWTRDDLQLLLPESLKQRAFEWAGSTTCRIERPAAEFLPADIRQMIGTELSKQLPPGTDIQILEMVDAEKFLVPSGALSTKVTLSPGTLRNSWGQASLEFSSQGELAVVKNVRFHWACTETVWQVLNPVTMGQVLSADSFQQVPLDVLALPGTANPALDFPAGKLAARPLTPGRILMANDWKEPTLVARDEIVTVSYSHNGLTITLRARALTSGIVDQVIQVQNLESRKIFSARIIDERTLVYEN